MAHMCNLSRMYSGAFAGYRLPDEVQKKWDEKRKESVKRKVLAKARRAVKQQPPTSASEASSESAAQSELTEGEEDSIVGDLSEDKVLGIVFVVPARTSDN